jgi:c-di-GMP-binding flagellar brake protein YcgR
VPLPRTNTQFFGAPQTAAPSAAAGQRRKLVRAAYVTPVQLVVGDVTIDGRSEDVSTGGVLMVCRQDCPVDGRGSLRFALPIGGKVTSVDVHVRWVRAARTEDPEGPRAVGLEFVHPSVEVTASIQAYVGFMTVPEGELRADG